MRRTKQVNVERSGSGSTKKTGACPFRLLHPGCNEMENGRCRGCDRLTNEQIRPYLRQAARLARRRGKDDPFLPDDTVQQFVVDMAENDLAEKFDPSRKSTPGAYCSGINRNTFKKVTRVGRHERLSLEGIADQVESSQCSPLEDVISSERRSVVREALSMLPPRYRKAICAEYGISLPGRDAEDERQVSRNDMVLHRARRRLAAILGSIASRLDLVRRC